MHAQKDRYRRSCASARVGLFFALFLLGAACSKREPEASRATNVSRAATSTVAPPQSTVDPTVSVPEVADVIPGQVITPRQVVLPPSPSGEELRNLVVKYDKFKDQWAIVTEPLELLQDKPPGAYDIRSRPLFMNVRAAIVREGEFPPALTADSSVGIVITSVAFDWQFLEDHTVWFLADGQRSTYETTRSSSLNPLTETLVAAMPLERFVQLVSAHSVAGKVGSQQFEIAQPGLEKLRAFAGALQLYPYDILRRAEAGPRQGERPPPHATPLPSIKVSTIDLRNESAASGTASSSSSSTRTWAEQVYVDTAVATYYPETCMPRPARTVRLSKSIAISKGYVLAPQCKQ
jgi:hypothetical protein